MSEDSKHLGKRYVYTVETNPHDYGAKPGTYEGEVIKVEHPGITVKNEDGTFRAIVLTIRCDDGSEVETSAFADYTRPIS